MAIISRAGNILVHKGEYRYFAGVSGTVSVPPNSSILSWTVYALSAGGTATIDGGSAIPIPVNGFITGTETGVDSTAAVFVFTGTSGYFIEYA